MPIKRECKSVYLSRGIVEGYVMSTPKLLLPQSVPWCRIRMIDRDLKEFVRGHLPSVLLPSFSIETLPGKRISCAPVETRFSEILNDEKPKKGSDNSNTYATNTASRVRVLPPYRERISSARVRLSCACAN